MDSITTTIGVETTATVLIPQSVSTETYAYTIVKASDGSTFASGNMIFVAGNDWRCVFTPDTADIYLLRVPHLTIANIVYGAYYIAKSVQESTTLSEFANNSKTALELVNEVLKNNGLKQITTLLNMKKIPQLAFDKLNKHIVDIGQEELWIPLEGKGTITLVEAQRVYDIATDLLEINESSFKFVDAPIEYMSQVKFDQEFPEAVPTANTPLALCREKNTFVLNAPTLAVDDGKTIRYRYWVDPPKLDENYPNLASWFPKGFDTSVLVSEATYDVMVYRGLSEAMAYKIDKTGSSEEEGAYSKFIRRFKSPVSDTVDVEGIV